MKYLFPFSDIQKNSRIILYGASDVGYDFYRQLVTSEYCHIVLWVDSQYEWFRHMNLPVESPEKIKDATYDCIVVAVEKRNTYESIRKDLMQLGADSKKIYWNLRYEITGNIAERFDKDRVKKEALVARLVDPITLIDENRLDIIIRYLYAADIVNGILNEYHKNLYKRLMMVQNNGSEPSDNLISDYFTEYTLKSGWEAFDSSFKELVGSMKDNGFLPEYFIPLDRYGKMINGAHRLAVALALNMKAYCYKYPFNGLVFSFDRLWLEDHGFENKDIEYIAKAYNRLKGVPE